MKTITLLFAIFLSGLTYGQQHGDLAYGKVFGSKPNTAGMMDASKVEGFMDKKTRISVTIKGKVLKVTKPKGGWFEIDAGNGKIINAHFSVYGITIPTDLKGKYVIADGIAEKQFIADDQQHFAGDTATGKKQHSVKTNPKQRLVFEVKGLMVSPPTPLKGETKQRSLMAQNNAPFRGAGASIGLNTLIFLYTNA